VDNFDPFYPRPGKEANLREIGPDVLEAFYEVDIRDEGGLARVLEADGLDTVVHLAARAGVRPSVQAPAEYMDVNVRGTVCVLEAARAAGVRSVIFGSSSSVYGAGNALPFHEDQPIQSPLSPYAASKVAGEALCYTYHHLYEMHITCLRFFTVYGPRQRPDLAINKFVRLMLAGEELTVYGDGSALRDYTFVSDIVCGIAEAMARDLPFAVINLASGAPVTVVELIHALEDVVGVGAQFRHAEPQPGDMPHTFGDIARAQELLGWRPAVSLRDGLGAFVEWRRAREA
jgi:UDP-glucuronate 4-epimerase